MSHGAHEYGGFPARSIRFLARRAALRCQMLRRQLSKADFRRRVSRSSVSAVRNALAVSIKST
jgi:hypothetical protein